ncbi:putative ion channel transport protein [Aurantimonas manganoxydans SI85-9A1]|uniref:Putative ion channel transport protein n=1 Tax=Aurantimonas manganoxydans (strain ATCC BAA-1229 / DSM 21871 / SI85-9A1) TaxID=287752 RepID=Q1YFL4_AURMS|nr:potassium channel family protein [Aurantimonas manganoxydans]EAS48959.1 putative ion channel transport protein [Aurantimonas manganoxydans SI85-9A1]
MLQSARPAHGRHRRRLKTRITRARVRLRRLYHGHTRNALRFQMAVLLVDMAIIAFFVFSPILRDDPSFLFVDYSVAAILAADVSARCFAARNPLKWLRQPFVLLDLVILATLLFPYTLINFGFLRIVRLWSISQSGVLWRPLRRWGHRDWEQLARAVVNLITFLFLATGFVYTTFFRKGSGLEGYLDALYFTVASVTTTGYGDITLPGSWGKLTSVVIMIIGISLFVRLAQAIFRPRKVDYPCPNCGLQRHDPDAVHCKACGQLLKIPDPGD